MPQDISHNSFLQNCNTERLRPYTSQNSALLPHLLGKRTPAKGFEGYLFRLTFCIPLSAKCTRWPVSCPRLNQP